MTQKRNMGSLRFIALWTLGHLLSWLSMWLVLSLVRNLIWDTIWFFVLFAVGIGTVLTIAQRWLIEKQYDIPLKNWIPYSLVGWLLGGLGASFFLAGPLWLFFGVMFAIPAILQAWVLRHYVTGAWVWALAGAASGLLLSTQLGETANPFLMLIMPFIALLVQSLVTGLSAIWLFDNNDRRKSKRKNEADNMDSATYRLQTNDDAGDWQDDDETSDTAGRLRKIVIHFIQRFMHRYLFSDNKHKQTMKG